MKKLLIFILIVSAAGYFWQRRQVAIANALHPLVIANPVFAETRIKLDHSGGTIEGVILAQTVDQADCQGRIKALENDLERLAPKVCPQCKMQPSQCKSELAPRYLRLFEDSPTHVTYLSLPRGERIEREVRMIYWGITVEQSHQLCTLVSEVQKGRKGTVKCIRAFSQ